MKRLSAALKRKTIPPVSPASAARAGVTDPDPASEKAGPTGVSPEILGDGASTVLGADAATVLSDSAATMLEQGGATVLDPGASGGLGPAAAVGGLQPGSKLGPRYEILAVLGQGGMGAVYKARDLELDRLVALKVIRPEMASHPEVIERFKREILLSSKVTHRNVVRIFDLGEADGVKFISMSFVEGETLKTLLVREGKLTVERALPILRELLDALAAAHDAGVIHRDLKPQNVMLDAAGHAYIADFGISHSLDSGEQMTRTGMLLGTVDYMSPEQARGDHPDARSDIYSLGLILYEVFAGRPPFESETALSALVHRIEANVPTIKLARPDLPSWMAGVITRALKKDPADRYQTAREMLKDIEARHASIAWKRRLRPRVLVPTVVVAALVVSGVAFAVRGLRARAVAAPSGGAAPAAVAPVASVAVLPFANATGDPKYDWTKSGLSDLLVSELRQAPDLRVTAPDRLAATLGTLKIGDAPPSPEMTRRIAGILNVENLVTPTLYKAGSTFRLEARLARIGAASAVEAAPVQVQGEGEDALFGLLDQLSEKVMQELGSESANVETAAGRLATSNVEAMRAYSEGVALARGGADVEASALFEKALSLDPGFAIAGAALAESYDRMGRAADAAAAADQAVQGMGRTSPAEAARIRAVRARIAGDLEDAEQAYAALRDASPADPEAWLQLASVQEERGALEGALISLRRSVELDSKNPASTLALGRVLVKTGQAAEGLSRLETARDLQRAAGNDEGVAAALNGIGNVYKNALGQDAEALAQYEQSLALRRKIGDKRGEAVVLGNIGLVQINRAQYKDAIGTMQQARDIWAALGDPSGLAAAWANLGDAYDSAGNSDEALKAYQEGLKLVEDAGDLAGQARTESSLGSIYGTKGQYVEARHWQAEALDKRRKIGDKREIIRSLSDLGITELFLGKYEEALKHNEEGITLAKEVGDQVSQLSLQINVANIYEDQGAYGPALATLAETEKDLREIKNDDLLPYCLAYRGSTLTRIGDAAQAKASLDATDPFVREADNKAMASEFLALKAALLIAQGQNAAAPLAKQALAGATEVKDYRLILTARYLDARIRGSRKDLERALADAKASGLAPMAAPIALTLAKLHQKDGNGAQAAKLAAEAESSARSLGQSDYLFQALALAQPPGVSGPVPPGTASALTRIETGLEGGELKALRERPDVAAVRRRLPS